MQSSKNTQLIKQKAYSLGFDFVGISKADFLHEEAPLLENWLKNGRHAGMTYMENHYDKRLDPRLLVPGAQSVLSLMLNYYPEQTQASDTYQLAKYAYGRDYHKVIKKKIQQLITFIRNTIGAVEGRAFVDSAPVLERAWAKKSGLGWVGKNANLIHPKAGSFFFLAELIIDLPLVPDGPMKDYCGSCTKCIDACPTDAIVGNNQIDSNKCISYLTIELKSNTIPSDLNNQFKDWMYGCDICQDVCPWNRFAKQHQTPDFSPKPELLAYNKKDWEEISEAVFNQLFEGSAVKRAKFSGLKRNINFISRSKSL